MDTNERAGSPTTPPDTELTDLLADRFPSPGITPFELRNLAAWRGADPAHLEVIDQLPRTAYHDLDTLLADAAQIVPRSARNRSS